MRISAKEQANLYVIQMSFEKVKTTESANNTDFNKLLNAIHRAKISMDFLIEKSADGITTEPLGYLREIKREIVDIEINVMKNSSNESERNKQNEPYDDMAS